VDSAFESLAELAKWADPASTSLVLGAGASMPSGLLSGADLAQALAARFEVRNQTRDLTLVSEIIENKVGRRQMVDTIRDLLNIDPVGGILQVPKYAWRSIYTTNYDDLIERAAKIHGNAVTRVRSSYDLPELENLGRLRLFKIHGCITQDHCYGDPSSIVITKTDYRKVRNWKSDLLRRMQVDLETSKVLIIGQSLSDQHLDELVQDVADRQAESGFKGRVRILVYHNDDELAAVWEARGIKVSVGDIDHFMSLVASAPSDPARVTSGAHAGDAHAILPDRLSAVTIDVSHNVRIPTPVRKMFTGSPASYFDIASGRTFERDLGDAAVDRLVQRKVCVVRAAAGLGKTTLARQAVLKRREAGAVAWEHRTDLPLDIDAWVEVDKNLRAAGLSGVLFLDNSTTYQRKVNDLLRRLGDAESRRLEIITTAEAFRWQRLAKHPELLKLPPLTPGKLSTQEVARLLELVRSNADVRDLVPPDFIGRTDSDQRHFLRRVCASDIFICLRNVFQSGSFDTIVLDEFNSLDEDIQHVYRLVAGLEAICGGSHRQLIMRMLDLEYNEIDPLLDRLDGLLVEFAQSEAEGIYVWRTRHSEIAEIIARYKFSDPFEHDALVKSLIDHINVTVDIERNAIRGLCNQPFGLESIGDRDERIDILESLIGKLPDDHVLRHRIIREFIRGGDYSAADMALNRAESEVGIDPPLSRYRVELYRRRALSEEGLQREDREALLRWAWDRAQQARMRYSDNWYSYRSLIEVGVDWFEVTGSQEFVDQAIEIAEAAYARLFDPSLKDAITSASRRLGRFA
jgi:hypothetical protein